MLLIRKLFAVAVLLSGHLSQAQTTSEYRAEVERFYALGDLKSALVYARKAVEQARKEFGESHMEYANTCLDSSQIHIALGDKIAGENGMVKAITLMEKQDVPEKNPEYCLALSLMCQYYLTTLEYNKVDIYLLKQIDALRNYPEKGSYHYAELLQAIGYVYVVTARYKQGLSYLSKSHDLKSKLLPKEHIKYFDSLNLLGFVYNKLDDFTKAIPLMEEAMYLRKKIVGENHIDYWYSLNNVAGLYSDIGDYERAILLLNELINKTSRTHKSHELYLDAVNSIAMCYSNLNQFRIADSILTATLPIYQLEGVNKPRHLAILFYNRATIYQDWQQDYGKAKIDFINSINTCIKFGDYKNAYSISHNLSTIYIQTKEYDKADSTLKKILNYHKLKGDTNNIDYLLTNSYMSTLLYEQKKYEEAVKLSASNIEHSSQLLKSKFLYLSERQKQAYAQRMGSIFIQSVALSAKVKSNSSNQLLYQATIGLKNIVLNDQVATYGMLRRTRDTTTSYFFDSLQIVRRKLTEQFQLASPNRLSIDSLQIILDRLENKLSNLSASYRQAQSNAATTWRDIQKALRPRQAAIEFLAYKVEQSATNDSIIYVALVLRPGWLAPKLVPLTHEKALAALLKDGPNSLTAPQLGLLRARTQTLTNTGQLAQGAALYRAIWQPLDSLLRGVKQVWVSPSGLLHKVAFAALPLPGKVPGFLADTYTIRVVGSTRTVASSVGQAAKSPRTALFYGGVDYGTAPTSTTAAWPALPGTQQEVKAIGALWGASATVVTGQQATKTKLQQALGITSPDVLHLATHSFFRALTDQRTDFTRPASDPVLLRSGVVMARANVPGADSLNPDNGILSGLELANLNLANTELVVLSGCETGLGDIRGSEGVFGLQRAVKMAGAKHLLMSLWPVPDGPTSQFMIAFYRSWKTPHTTLHQAFARTQQAFRKQYPPAVWAAFVLVE